MRFVNRSYDCGRRATYGSGSWWRLSDLSTMIRFAMSRIGSRNATTDSNAPPATAPITTGPATAAMRTFLRKRPDCSGDGCGKEIDAAPRQDSGGEGPQQEHPMISGYVEQRKSAHRLGNRRNGERDAKGNDPEGAEKRFRAPPVTQAYRGRRQHKRDQAHVSPLNSLKFPIPSSAPIGMSPLILLPMQYGQTSDTAAASLFHEGIHGTSGPPSRSARAAL